VQEPFGSVDLGIGEIDLGLSWNRRQTERDVAEGSSGFVMLMDSEGVWPSTFQYLRSFALSAVMKFLEDLSRDFFTAGFRGMNEMKKTWYLSPSITGYIYSLIYKNTKVTPILLNSQVANNSLLASFRDCWFRNNASKSD